MSNKDGKKKPSWCRGIMVPLAIVAVLMFLAQYTSTKNIMPAAGISDSKNDTDQKCEAMLDRFDAMFDERRRVRQQHVSESIALANERWFFDAYEPEATCFTDERFGYSRYNTQGKILLDKNLPQAYKDATRYNAFGDGPKFVCGLDVIGKKDPEDGDKEPCLVYSVGSNNDVAFEMTVDKFLGCETHTFDPTISNFVGGDYATWHPWGLGVDGAKARHESFEWEGKSFDTIIEALGHQNRTIDILKIDCEGCEWSTMPPLFESIAAGTIKVHQIQVEMHIAGMDTSDPRNLSLRNIFFQKLDKAKMRIFHKERNHWGCMGYKCLEYAFVSEEFLRIANKAAACY